MVKFSTRLAFDVCVERKQKGTTIRTTSKVLKVVKEIIQKHRPKDDVNPSG